MRHSGSGGGLTGSGGALPVSLIGTDWDSFTVAYPNATTEVYTFTLNAVTVVTITLVYTDGTKTDLASGTKV